MANARSLPPALKSLATVVAALLIIAGLSALMHSSWGSPSIVYPILRCGVWAVAAVGLNIVLGFTGQFSLGHAGFMAVGGYTAAMITTHYQGSDPLGLVFFGATVLGGVMAAIAGWLVGVPSLRLRGDYLAIVTLGFGEIIRSIIENSKTLGEATGISGIPTRATFFWVFGWLALSVIFVYRLLHSTHGRALLSVREDEIAAEAMGINTTKYKVRAFVMSAFFGGIAGSLFAHVVGNLQPSSFIFVRSIEVVTMVVLGGMGSTTGAILAAFAVTLLPELLQYVQQGPISDWAQRQGWSDTTVNYITKDYKNVIFSFTLVVMMLVRPKGLLGKWEIWRLWQKGSPPTPERSSAENILVGGLAGHKDQAPATDVLLDVNKATIRFGGLTAVKEFSVQLRPRELVALIGPNGAGKTTVFNLLTSVYQPTEGTIRVNGVPTAGLRPHKVVALGAARTFQNIRLFKDLTVFDNVRIACHHLSRQSIAAAVRKAGVYEKEEGWISERADELLRVMGLFHRRDEIACNLPYGEQRRLEIARALATGPKVLLLDEPAAGMNAREKVDLMELIRSIRDRFGVAILLIEHDMKLVMGVSERIIVLDHGETIAQGTPREIQQNPKVIEAYLGAEAATVAPALKAAEV